MDLQKNAPDFLSGGGEMGERIRDFDWSKTPLGEPEHWQQSLKTCVRIMLTSSQPIWIGWGKDLIKLYNDPYRAIAGGKHPGALGQPASMVWKDIWKDIASMLERVMEKNEGTYVESQLLIMERNGYPEETYFTFSYTPIPGDSGGTEGMFCANTDNTDRIISERQLRTLTQLGKALIDAKTTKEVFDNTIRTLKENPQDFPFAALYELDADGKMLSLAGKTTTLPETAFPPEIEMEKAQTLIPLLAEVTETRKPMVLGNVIETFGALPSGPWQQPPHELILVPISSPSRKHPAAILKVGLNPYRKADEKYRNFFDLVADQIATGVNNVENLEAERQRMEALEALDKSKTIFFSNISHEFRTPITLMLGPLEELLQHPSGNLSDQEMQSIATTHRNAMRLLKLVNTLLDFSRIESGRQQAVYVRTDIATLTENLAGNFRSVMEKAGLELIVHAQSLIQPVYVDRQMWEKIIFNLLSNAFKYTLKGRISVVISENEHAAIVTVEDTGVGIPEHEIPHMFERFHRVQNTTGRTHEGTGIGLSLIREFVKLHGGTIEVESTEGVGSAFTVTIPHGKAHLPADKVFDQELLSTDDISIAYVKEANSILDSNVIPEPVTTYLNEHPEQSGKRKDMILIVDDNADMRQHIEAVVSTKYDTMLAGNGAEALEKIHMHKPALVLSDIMMPVMDGISLLKEIKDHVATHDVPVILITARAGEESKIEGYETGADDYLVKPFSARELLARIKAQVDLSRKRRAIARQSQDLFEQAPTAIVILKGPELVFELANDRALEIIGKSKTEVIGKKIAEALPELDQQGFVNLLRMVYETGERFVAAEAPVRFLSNGVPTDTFVKYVFQPLKDEDNNITGVMVVGDDIGELVQARKRIEESEKHFRTLAETLPNLVWMTDAQGNQLYVSNKWEEYTGFGPISPETWISTVHPDDVERASQHWQHILQSGDSYNIELRLRSKEGEYRWHFGQAKPLYDINGKIIRWIGGFTDIHEQKIFAEKLEKEVQERTAELVKANKELESFNYVASHDLQEPLRKIQTFISLMEKNRHDYDASEKYFQKIVQSTQRMRDLIQSILVYSQLSKSGTEFRETDLNKILGDVKNDLELVIEDKKAAIQSDMLPVIHANALQMHQLFSNLIGNSLKFSRENPVIRIGAAIEDDAHLPFARNTAAGRQYLHLTFADNGIGFEPEFKEQIFNLFQRLHGKDEFKGTGIGLSIVKKIVEHHKGFVTADSRPNEGATFHIWLPAGVGA